MDSVKSNKSIIISQAIVFDINILNLMTTQVTGETKFMKYKLLMMMISEYNSCIMDENSHLISLSFSFKYREI